MQTKFILISLNNFHPIMGWIVDTDIRKSVESQFSGGTWKLIEISDELYNLLDNGEGVMEQSEPTKYSQIY